MSLGKRVNQLSWRHPETTGKGRLEVGKDRPSGRQAFWPERLTGTDALC